MKKLFPYKLVKYNDLKSCCERVGHLESDIANATEFIKNIESGNLDAELKGVSGEVQNDVNSLAGSLLSMRNQLRSIKQQELERNWVTEGLAKFVEILRSNNEDIKSLSDKILSNLVKYLNANQGYLYIYNDTVKEEAHLELVACFAYNKKKYLEQTINIGEGLIGQCYLEKETIYLTEIPDGYIKITSGVGEALPRNIIIVPLKLNEEVYGIVEMASFFNVKKYQIEFIEKLGESIASTIANVKVSERTKKLLADSQVMTEQLRSQEEEMRQNMEELSATQEEMQRRQTEIDEANQRFLLVNESSSEGLWEIKDFESASGETDMPIWFSDKFCSLLGFRQSELKPRVSTWMERIHPGDVEKVMNNFNNHLNDKSNKTPYDIDYRLMIKSGEYRWFNSRGTTLRNDEGNPLRVAGALKDIHEEKVANEKLSHMLHEVKDKEVYMRNLMHAMTDAVITVDQRYNVELFNAKAGNMFNEFGKNLSNGLHYLEISPEADKDEKAFINVLQGETVSLEWDFNNYHFYSKYSPIRNDEGNVVGLVIVISDVTNQHNLQLEIKNQSEELKAQEEELRQNLEELTATQEELQRKAVEIEKIRETEKERADNQINSQKKLMEQFMLKSKEKENGLLQKIKELEAKLSEKITA